MHAIRVQKLRGNKIIRVEAGSGAVPPGRRVFAPAWPATVTVIQHPGGFVGQLVVEAAIGPHTVVGAEDLAEVVAQLGGVVDREAARAVEQAHG
jgi:hypothetical protein